MTLRDHLNNINNHTEYNIQKAVAFVTGSDYNNEKFPTAEEIGKKIYLAAKSTYGIEDSVPVIPCVELWCDFEVHLADAEAEISETYIEWKELYFLFGEVRISIPPIDTDGIKDAVELFYGID